MARKRPIADLLTYCRALRVADADADRAFIEEEPDHTIGEAMNRRDDAIRGIREWLDDVEGPLPSVASDAGADKERG